MKKQRHQRQPQENGPDDAEDSHRMTLAEPYDAINCRNEPDVVWPAEQGALPDPAAAAAKRVRQ